VVKRFHSSHSSLWNVAWILLEFLDNDDDDDDDDDAEGSKTGSGTMLYLTCKDNKDHHRFINMLMNKSKNIHSEKYFKGETFLLQ